MSYILAIIIGAAIGLIAKETAPTRQNQTLLCITGATGGLLGLWFFCDILNIDPIVSFGTLSLMNILYVIIGSIVYIILIDHFQTDQQVLKQHETYPLPARKLTPVYTHQFESIKIKTKKKRK